MKMVRVLIQLPQSLKTKLESRRPRGTSTSGFVRELIARELHQPAPRGQKER